LTYFAGLTFSLTAGQTSTPMISFSGLPARITLVSGVQATFVLEVFDPLTQAWVGEESTTMFASQTLYLDSYGFRFRLRVPGGYSGSAAFFVEGPGLALWTTADQDEIVVERGVLKRRHTLPGTPEAPPPLPGSLQVLFVGQSTLVATLTAGAGGGGGGSAPAAPTLAGLTLEWDFDFGAPATGPLTTLLSQAGVATTAEAAPGAGAAPAIITLGNGRKALDFDGVDDFVTITNGLAVVNSADNAPHTTVVVSWRDVAGVTQGILGATKATLSGASTVNRYELFYATDSQLGRRADGSNSSDAAMAGAPSLVAPNIYVLSYGGGGAQRVRGMHNGGTKVTSTVDRNVLASPAFTQWTLGARMVNPNGTTRSNFLDGKVERTFHYAGAASDADMDAIHAALATYYTA
jgi:hypothetical protein